MKPRPTVLVAEPEPAEALSTRKLVLEAAKFNVLTAHSTKEALELLQIFPNIATVIVADSDQTNCEQISRFVKSMLEKLPVIALSPLHGHHCKGADHYFSSHDPDMLVQHLFLLLGDPRKLS